MTTVKSCINEIVVIHLPDAMQHCWWGL